MSTQSSGLSGRPELAAQRGFWDEFAPYCEGHPSKGDCDDGDMNLFNGLLCASGDARGCAAVQAAQGPDGRWWRSPRRVGTNLGKPNSFSRDMSLGVMLYLATTRDTAAAERWITWIEKNRPCSVTNPFTGGCTIRGPHRMCRDDTDGRCTMTPATWALLHRVWSHIGLSPTSEMRTWEGADGDISQLEARINDPGYQQHLNAVAVFLKQVMNQSRAPRQEIARILAEGEPGNPFFVYLRDGASAQVFARVAEVCPKRDSGIPARRFQWSWERATSSQAWLESMGWDCIFMDNLLGSP